MTMENTDVIIIGAGSAGITAAHTLSGKLDTIILEANADRIGGRVYSSLTWPDETCDLGASWITHELINPLTDFVEKHHIKVVQSELLNFGLRDAQGKPLSDDEIAALFALFEEIYVAVKEEAEEREGNGEVDCAASDAFERAIASRNLSRDEELGVRYFLNYSVAEPNASDVDKLSLYRWDDDLIFAQAALAVFPNGYVEIFEKMAKDLDIRMNHVVTEICRDRDGVTVRTSNGNEFRASYAIVTLPHGVLKHGVNEGSLKFEPALPQRKVDAINRLETGLSDKFYFRFDECFWEKDKDMVNLVDPDGNGAWSTWINFYRYTGRNVLACFNRTEHAKRLQSMSDDAVIDEAMQVITRVYGPRSRPQMQRSHWGTDPFSRGTLAYVPPGASSDDFTMLGLPTGRICFAGDSTVAAYHGTVFAAYLSGVREATRILYRLAT